MIIVNGTLQAALPQKASLNEWGEAQESEEQWGETLPCQWLLPTANEQARFQTEQAPSFSYVALIEARHFQHAHRYRLNDHQGKTLGTFPLHRIEHLDAVHQVRLFL